MPRGTRTLGVVVIALGASSRAMAADEDPSHASTTSAPASGPAAPPEPLPRPIATIDIVRANLEPSYLTFPIIFSGVDPLVFETSVVPHFFLLPATFPVALVLTPKIVLRMYQGPSVPVKTPSYMPRLTLYAWFDKTFTGLPLFYSSLTLDHHSNGQSGPFLNPDGTNNHENGSFATTFFELSFYRAGWKPKLLDFAEFTLEWHPGIGDELGPPGRYGRLRAHLETTVLVHLLVDAKLSVKLTSIVDRFQRASDRAVGQLERFPFFVRYIVKIPSVDVGIYASYYVGHDYYNIWFDQVANMLQIGIGADVASSLPPDY